MKNLKVYALIIGKKQVINLGLLTILLLVCMFIETLSIGIILPIFSELTNSKAANSNNFFLKNFIQVFFEEGHQLSLSNLLIILLAIYFIKLIFVAIVALFQNKVVYAIQENLSSKLFSVYLNKPYTFHLQKNTAYLVQHMTGGINAFRDLIQGFVTLVSEVLVLLGISIVLIMAEPTGSIVVIVIFGFISTVFMLTIKKKVFNWGKSYLMQEELRMKHLQQGLSGVKMVKFYGKEESFLSKYIFHTRISVRAARLNATLMQLPRVFLEFFSVVGIIVLSVVMTFEGKPTSLILPSLALFTAAAFRISPSVNKILGQIQILKYTQSIVATLKGELQLVNDKKISVAIVQPAKFENTINIENLWFKYDGSDKYVLKNVSFELSKGKSIGIIGKSGAGKSTLVDIILGLLPPQKGTIKVDGIDMTSNLLSWQKLIGYVPQDIYLTDDTFKSNIAFGVNDAEIDEERVKNAIKGAQLEELVANFKDGLNEIIGERGVRLSGGQRQRIGIARALYNDPPILVLDEATSALDNETEAKFVESIESFRNQKTLIIIAHRLSTVKNCDHIIKLNSGEIELEKDVQLS